MLARVELVDHALRVGPGAVGRERRSRRGASAPRRRAPRTGRRARSVKVLSSLQASMTTDPTGMSWSRCASTWRMTSAWVFHSLPLAQSRNTQSGSSSARPPPRLGVEERRRAPRGVCRRRTRARGRRRGPVSASIQSSPSSRRADVEPDAPRRAHVEAPPGAARRRARTASAGRSCARRPGSCTARRRPSRARCRAGRGRRSARRSRRRARPAARGRANRMRRTVVPSPSDRAVPATTRGDAGLAQIRAHRRPSR